MNFQINRAMSEAPKNSLPSSEKVFAHCLLIPLHCRESVPFPFTPFLLSFSNLRIDRKFPKKRKGREAFFSSYYRFFLSFPDRPGIGFEGREGCALLL